MKDVEFVSPRDSAHGPVSARGVNNCKRRDGCAAGVMQLILDWYCVWYSGNDINRLTGDERVCVGILCWSLLSD